MTNEGVEQMTQDVLFDVQNGIGWVTLNRPKAINALSLAAVDAIGKQLKIWKDDNRVALVVFKGNGEKGFCAGGDMRSLYDKKDSGVMELAYDFFSIEYDMNILIHRYPKPTVAFMDGIVMGGGIGIAIACSERIVTEKSKLAMPEMNIGFFPDVGGSYFLNKMPGYSGYYWSLTSDIIGPADALYTGVANRYMEKEKWNDLAEKLGSVNFE